MAEHLLRLRAAQRGLSLEVASCGVAAEPWYKVPESARRQLSLRGVPPFEHKARLATREPLRWADLVLTMTAAQRDHLLDLYPEFGAKVRLFQEYAGRGEEDVADPMGRSEEVFAACLAVIERSLDDLLASGFRPVVPR